MKYYSTNKKAPLATLAEAVVNGLAPDKGLYMPERIKRLPNSFYKEIDKLCFNDIACSVADAFFGDNVSRFNHRVIIGAERHQQPLVFRFHL